MTAMALHITYYYDTIIPMTKQLESTLSASILYEKPDIYTCMGLFSSYESGFMRPFHLRWDDFLR